MKIVAIACARNEADIIEPFVRHTLSFCDHLILMDHGSADATPDILRSLQSEGLNLRVLTDHSVGNFQTAHMNLLMKLAVGEFAADWVVCLDADEFIQGDLAGSLGQGSKDGTSMCQTMPLRNYVAHPGDPVDIVNPVERITHHDCNATEVSTFTCKVIVPRELAMSESSFLEQGNHRFLYEGFEAPSRLSDGVWLGHFSLRQASQYAGKLVAKTLQKYRQTAERTHNEDFYEGPYRKLARSYSEFAKDFPKARLSWISNTCDEQLVRKPIDYRGGPLSYTPAELDTDQFIKQILDLTEKLACSPPPDKETVDQASVPPPAFISIFADGNERATSVRTSLRQADSEFVSLTFSLRDFGDCSVLVLGASTDPCILEIDSISLKYGENPESVKIFDHDALKSMLWVRNMCCIINSAAAVRVIVSQLPMQLTIKGWRKSGEPMPVEATLRLRRLLRPKDLVSIVFAPNVVGFLSCKTINRPAGDLKNIIPPDWKLQGRTKKRKFKAIFREWRKRLFGVSVRM